MCKFFAAPFKIISIFCLNGILDSTGYRVVHAENLVEELYFSSCIPL